METQEQALRVFVRSDGRAPFLEWLNNLRDQRAEQRIDARLGRVRLGNLGDCRSVGEGVRELRIDYGPGYRIYFGKIGETVIILLVGGDKSTQDEDINEAKEYWAEFKKRGKLANY